MIYSNTIELLKDFDKPWSELDKEDKITVATEWLWESDNPGEHFWAFEGFRNLKKVALAEMPKGDFIEAMNIFLLNEHENTFSKLAEDALDINKADRMADRGAVFIDKGDDQYWQLPTSERMAA